MYLHARRMSLRSCVWVQTALRIYLFPWVGTLPLLQHRCTNFPKIWQPRQNSGRQEVCMKQVTCWGTTDIGRHVTKFGRPGDLTPVFCAPLSYTPFSSKVNWFQEICMSSAWNACSVVICYKQTASQNTTLTLNIPRGVLWGPHLVCYWLTSVEINKHKIFDTNNAWITEL